MYSDNNLYDEDRGDISPSEEDYSPLVNIVNQPRDLRDSLIQDEEQLYRNQFYDNYTENNRNNDDSYIGQTNKKYRVDNSNNSHSVTSNNNNNNRINAQLAISQKLKLFAKTLLTDSKHNEIPDVNILSPPTQQSPPPVTNSVTTNQDFDMTVELKTLIEEPMVVNNNQNNSNNNRSRTKRNPTPVQNAIRNISIENQRNVSSNRNSSSTSNIRELNTDEDFFNAEWDISKHAPVFIDQNSKFQRKAYAANSQVKHEFAASDEKKHSGGTRKGRGGKKVGFSSSALKEVNLSLAKPPPQPMKPQQQPQQQSQQVSTTTPSNPFTRRFDLDLVRVKKEPNTINKDDIEETGNTSSNNNHPNSNNNTMKLEPRSNSPPKTPEKRGMKDWMAKESTVFEFTSPSSNNYTNSSGSGTYIKKGELQLKPRSGPLTTRLFRLIEAQNSASHILEHKARLGEIVNTIDYSRSLIVRILSISNHYSLHCCIGLLCSPYSPQVVNLGDRMQQSAINQSINAKQYTHSTSSTAYWSVVSLELLEEYSSKCKIPLNLLCIVFFRPDCASRLRLRENQYVKLTWPWLLIEEIITKEKTIKTILNTFDGLEFDSQQGLIQENLQIQRENNQLTEAEIQSFEHQYSSSTPTTTSNNNNNVETPAIRNLQSKRALIEESGRNELLTLLNSIGEENLERELFGDQEIKAMDIDGNKDQNNKELMEIANSQPIVRVFKQIPVILVNNFNLSLTDQSNSTERKFIAGVMQKISLCGAAISQADQMIQNHPIFTLESSLPYIIIRDESGIAMISIPLPFVPKFASLFCCGNPNNIVIYFTNLAVNRANLFIGTSTINSYLSSYCSNSSTRLVQLIVTPCTRFTVSNAAESLQIERSTLFREQSPTPLKCLIPSEICKFSINSRVNVLARITLIEWIRHEYCLLYLSDQSLHADAATYTTSTVIVKFNVLYHLKLLRSYYKDESQSGSYPFARCNPIYLRDLLIDQTNSLLVADCFSDILIPNITESNEFLHNSSSNNSDKLFPRTVEDCITHEILQSCIYSITSSELPLSCSQLYNFFELLISHPINPLSISPTLQFCGLFNLKGQIIDILSHLTYATECVDCLCPLTSVESSYYHKILSKSNTSVQILCPRCHHVNNSVTSTYNLLVKLKSDSVIEPINLLLNSYYIDKLLGHLTQRQIELAITNQDELVTFIRMQTIQCIAKIHPSTSTPPTYQQLQTISITEESMQSVQFISLNPTPFYISQ